MSKKPDMNTVRQIDNIRIQPSRDSAKELRFVLARKLDIHREKIGEIRILKRSVDARKRDAVTLIYSVECTTNGRTLPKKEIKKTEILKAVPTVRPVVVGSGPAGMFCALALAQSGASPIIIERGKPVEQRTSVVETFFETGSLDPECNVQFGEGGAGTFSDGKLTTGIKNERIAKVNGVFAECGAPEEILYSSKPHIGTDKLREVVSNIRKKITELGGEYRFSTKLIDINIDKGRLTGITLLENGDGGRKTYEMECERLVLATGHSARDTFEMLYSRGLEMRQKQFSVGVRIEHPQGLIDRTQYGRFAGEKSLGAADYKLSAKTSDGRGVYTFCMCPGGYVVAAASETGCVVTNGMSLYSRDAQNANSAVLVSVGPDDFGGTHPLAGVEFQRKIEKAAYQSTNSYKAPAQLVGDFINNVSSKNYGEIRPSYRPGVVMGSIACCLPDFVVSGIKEGIRQFDKKLKGFMMPDAVMTAPETRSSSPVRIVRGEDMQSSIKGIYPCGEGAGYAGGIMSAAVDGLCCAERIIEEYR